MTPERVLDHPALVLDQRERKRYFDEGFLTLPGYVAPVWLDRLRAVVAMFEQFDDDGRWTGALADRDVATLPTDTAAELGGPAGTVVLLHCRVVHGSAANYSPRMRPLLLNVYAAADALPMTPAPTPTSRTGLLVRGREPAQVHMEPYPARLPPRWDQVGYRSIFSAQAPPSSPALVDEAPARPAP